MKIGPVSLLGVGTGYRATLMSGGSHRLWNQLLHATLFRSASLFRWRTRRLAFQSRVQFSPLLQNPAAHQKSLSLSLSALDRVSTKKKDLFRTGRNCSKRRIERSDQSRLRSTRVYKNAYYIIHANYHRRSKSIAETGSQLSSIRAYFLRSWPQA